jgi:phage baseplate assembly protein W
MPYPYYKYTYPNNPHNVGFVGPINNVVDNSTTLYSSLYDSNSAGELIRQSILRILGENRMERVMLPNFGSRLKSQLFDPNDEILVKDIQKEIKNTLSDHEPRISVTDVLIEQDINNNSVYVTVIYKIPISGASQIIKLLIK